MDSDSTCKPPFSAVRWKIESKLGYRTLFVAVSDFLSEFIPDKELDRIKNNAHQYLPIDAIFFVGMLENDESRYFLFNSKINLQRFIYISPS